MARMVPSPMLPTQSRAEEQLYEALRNQLDDSFACYQGIGWVRFGRRPDEGESDFMIAHPDLGVLVVEVKGGELAYDPPSRTWTRLGSGERVKDPFTQAQRNMHWVKDQLELLHGHDRWMPALGYGVALPNGEYTEQAHPAAPLRIVIDRRDMGSLGDRVPTIMRMWARDGRGGGGTDAMQALEEALGYRVEVLVPLGRRVEEAEHRTIRFTPEQAYVRDLLRMLPRAAVMGTAGSGKTLIAIETAAWLSRQGKRTLVTCFNKRLGQHLAEATARLDDVYAIHFHELAYRLGVGAGIIEEFDPTRPATDNDPYFTHALPAALADAAGRVSDRFDAIVVDEAQDFQDAYWEALLRLHASPDDRPLYLFADDNQNIYRGAGLPLSDNEILPALRTNMRNSREIQEFLAALYRHVEGAEAPEVDGEPMGPVGVIPYASADELVRLARELIDDLVTRQGCAVSDIALLTPSRAAKSLIREDGMLGDLRLSETPEPGCLLTSSIHGFKGLERPIVIIAELGERGEERLVEYLYVGGSRARYRLLLIATADLAPKLAQLPSTEMLGH